MSKTSEVNSKIEEVDAECRRFLGEFSEHVLPDVASPSMKKIVAKVLDMWRVYHSDCKHDPKPFALIEPSQTDKPTVWISPDGDWVVMIFDPTSNTPHPKPTKISLSDLSQMNMKPADLVKAIRRQMHFMALHTMTTQSGGVA